MRYLSRFAAIAAVGFALGACAVDPTSGDDGEPSAAATDPLSLRLRDWDHQAAANLSCNGDVKGVFTRASNQHYYSFPAAKGQKTSFTLAGQWPDSLGAIVIVTDNHYKTLAWRGVSYGAKVSTDVTFAEDAKVFVFAAPLRTYHGAKPLPYTLAAACAGCTTTAQCGGGEQCDAGTGSCVARPLCVQVTTPSGTFIAKNFMAGQWAEANAWGTEAAAGGAWGISLATCGEVAKNAVCTKEARPVCAVSWAWPQAQTFGNPCGMRSGVMAEAGDYGEVAAVSLPGACAAPGSPRCATYSLSADLAAGAAYYASNWNSDAEAKAWISLQPTALNGQVLPGACSDFTACTKEYAPVCGNVKSEPEKTFGNRCSLEATVRADAGSAGSSKGRYATGACVP